MELFDQSPHMSITTKKNHLGFTACLPNHHLGKKGADRIRDTLG